MSPVLDMCFILQILAHTNNAFELLSNVSVSRPQSDQDNYSQSRSNGEKLDKGNIRMLDTVTV